MGLGVSRTTQPLRFDTGIGNASFAEVVFAPGEGQPQKPLLPGTTTVSQAVDELFPAGRDVGNGIMEGLVAGNPASLRTPTGFGTAARDAVAALRGAATPVSLAAAEELEALLEDVDLFERYRMSLLET